MQVYLLAATWAVVALVLYTIVNAVLIQRRNAAEAKRLGCGEPKVFPVGPLFGLFRVLDVLKHDKQRTFLEYLAGLYRNDLNDRTCVASIFGSTNVFTGDPKIIQAVLATQFNDFSLGTSRRNNFFPLLGNGIFTNDGKAWEHSRQLMRPQFVRDQISDLELEEDHVQNLLRAIEVNEVTGWTDTVDLSPLFFNLTLDSACEFLLGESTYTQIANLPSRLRPKANEKHANIQHSDSVLPFQRAFDKSQEWLATRFRFFDFYWLCDSIDFRKSTKLCHNFIDHFVHRALKISSGDQEKKVSTGRDHERYVFLEALARETRDPVELRSQLLNILLAGRDTTASLMGWTFYLLARHPEVFKKLRANILEHYGPYSSTERISFASIKSNTYLQNVINEVLRLYPVVPINKRQATRDTTLPCGGGPDGNEKLFIPKGSEVIYSVYIMHRREAIWGDDAAEFNPERWVGRRPGWEFLPFNGGPRICLGQQFALTEASYVIIRLMQRFDGIENMDPNPPTQYVTLTSCPGSGVQVRLKRSADA